MNHFYRATLWVSAVLAVVRCLSVTLVYCIKRPKDVIKFYSRPGSSVTLDSFEPIQLVLHNSKQNPSEGTWNRGWVAEISQNFRPLFRYILETAQDNAVIIIIIIPMTMFIVLSSWPQVIARVHSVHLMNVDQRQAAVDPQTKPRDLGCESACMGSYRLQSPSPFIIITQPESWYSFTVPRRVEGWVDLGTAGRVHTARAQGCKSVVVR